MNISGKKESASKRRRYGQSNGLNVVNYRRLSLFWHGNSFNYNSQLHTNTCRVHFITWVTFWKEAFVIYKKKNLVIFLLSWILPGLKLSCYDIVDLFFYCLKKNTILNVLDLIHVLYIYIYNLWCYWWALGFILLVNMNIYSSYQCKK